MNAHPPHVSQNDQKNPDCPDCPDSEVSNEDFLQSVFHGLAEGNRPICASFRGDPETVAKSAWFGKPWISGKADNAPGRNNFFSVASYKPDGRGEYRRKKGQFAALHAIMLDDVGTKVDAGRVSLAPSWKIETSTGNFQAGYILKQPITDAAEADRLMQAIIEAGLCDPGAGGPTARLCRLPVGINGKAKYEKTGITGSLEPFKTRLVEWHPERRFTLQELADGLQIDLSGPTAKRQTKGQAKAVPDDEVFIPRQVESAVVTELHRRGLYKQPLGDGKHGITCPWVHEHTDTADNGTAYFEPSESYPLGGFKCQHGHCAERHVGALLSFLGVARTQAKHKPTIRQAPGELPTIADAAEQLLSATGRHFQRGGVVVGIITVRDEAKVTPYSVAALGRALAGVAVWMRYDMRREDWMVADPGEKYIRAIHDAHSYEYLPRLDGIARQPYLRPDGSLMTRTGYDPATGFYGVFAEGDFPIPGNPTRANAEQALEELKGLLAEFAFVTETDRAAALSAMLTAAVRLSLTVAPMFHARAPQVSSGKSYLCTLIAVFATPKHGTPGAFPADDEEMRKLLIAELMQAPAVVEFDNLTTDLLPHKSLCTALTSPCISGRILGQSKTVEVSTRALFLSSGNNVGPVRDMARRTVTINLDPQVEIPAEREFHGDPVNEALKNRGRFVSLALTVVRAWICAGRPKATCKPLASYDEWSDLCRQPLLWLGHPDPAASVFASLESDPDREALGAVLAAWWTRHGNSPLLLKDVVKDAASSTDKELKEAITEVAWSKEIRDIDTYRFGLWMRRHAGRIVDGMRFVKDQGERRNAAKWKVEGGRNESGQSGQSGFFDPAGKVCPLEVVSSDFDHEF